MEEIVMNLSEAIRQFFRRRAGPVHLQDLYAAMPAGALEHSIRARVYENLGKHFRRVGRGLYVAVEGEAACVVVEGDALEEVRKLPTESVDALITDPPYAWLDLFRERATSSWKRMKVDFEKHEIGPELSLELYRVLREGAHAFVFVPAETTATRPHINRLIDTLERCGFVFRKRFVWDKCFHPDTAVLFKDSEIRVGTIEEVAQRTLSEDSLQVLGSEGRWVRVRRALVSQHNGPLVNIRTRDGSEIRVTPDHRLQTNRGLVRARDITFEHRLPCILKIEGRTKRTSLSTMEIIGRPGLVGKLSDRKAVNAGDLAEALGLRYNKAQWWLHDSEVPLRYHVPDAALTAVRPLFCHRWIPKELPLDALFGWIIGYYAAEGCAPANYVCFAQHETESLYAERVGSWAKTMGASVRRTIRPGTKAASLLVTGKAVALIMRWLVPGNARTKVLNPILLDGPPDFRRGIVQGWIDGDGHREKNTNRITIVTASPLLARQMSLLLRMEGQPCSYGRYDAKCQTGIFAAVRLRFSPGTHWNNTFSDSCGETAWVRISEIAREDYKGPVYDIEVDSYDHLFSIENGILAHNCNIGMGYSGRARHEGILFLTRGRAKRKPCDLTIPDVLSHRAIAPRRRRHPCEKPAGLLEMLIRFATLVGETVLDVFAGSCATGLAAIAARRNAVCIEKDGRILERALALRDARVDCGRPASGR